MKRRELYDSAMYGDCLPNGDMIVLRGNLESGFNATHFDSNLGRIDLPDKALFEDFPINKVPRIGPKLLFNRLTNAYGEFKIASKSHYSNDMWLYEKRSGWSQVNQNSHGVQGHAWKPDGILQVMKGVPNQESQGFRYYDISAPPDIANFDITHESAGFVTGSPTYNSDTSFAQFHGVKRLYGWTRIGNIIVGQGEFGGCVIQIQGRTRDNQWKLLEPGEAEFVQFHMVGSILSVAMTFLKARSVVLWWISEDEIDNLPDYIPKLEPKPEPKPKPEPEPKPEPKPGDSMKLSDRHIIIINALYAKNMSLARGSDDDRRSLTKMIAEQICFESGSNWGTKASTPTNPQSKDAIAFREANKLTSWDWQNGASREPQVRSGQEGENITGQFFIAVQPINHLGAGDEDTNKDTDEDTDNEDTTELLTIAKKIIDIQQKIISTQDAILNSQIDILQRIQVIIDKPIEIPPIKFPTYEGNNRFLGRITFTPKP